MRRLPGPIRLGILLGCVVAVGVVSQIAILFGSAWQVADAARRLSGGGIGVAEAVIEIDRLSGGLGAVEARIAPFDPLWRWLAGGPVVGREIGAARGLLGSGAALAAGARDLVEFGRPDPTVRGDRAFGAPPTVARRLRDEPEQVARAAAGLRRAVEARQSWPRGAATPLLARAEAALDAGLPVAEGLAMALPGLADALGARGPRTYLIVAQNNQELRPGGGFIGSFARLTIDQGAVTSFRFDDSYRLSGRGQRIITPPWPLREYGGLPTWLFRDANWSPDFPTNAERLIEMYQRERPEPVAGVIAVDLSALALILEAVGPVEVPEFGETVSAATLTDQIDRHVSYVGTGDSEHKEFLGAVGEKLVERILPPDPSVLPALGRAVGTAAWRKHIQVAVIDPVVGAGLRQARLDGHQAPVDGDYLMVVDANLGYNKVNSRVVRSVSYTVTLAEGKPAAAHLAVTYDHQRKAEPRRISAYDEYRNYARVYLPAGVHVRGVTGFRGAPRLEIEGDKLVVGGFLTVEPGDRATIEIDYNLLEPDSANQEYRLFVQHQAGLVDDHLTVQIREPAGQPIVAWTGPGGRDRQFAGQATARDRRPAGILLAPTDGILARIVANFGGRDSVDKAGGGRYTGLGLWL